MNAPAPWVPYTRAGCNFGAVGAANVVLENIAIDIPTVFGANSPEAAEVKSNPLQGFSDFVGIAILSLVKMLSSANVIEISEHSKNAKLTPRHAIFGM
jgi:hypothetical protein